MPRRTEWLPPLFVGGVWNLKGNPSQITQRVWKSLGKVAEINQSKSDGYGWRTWQLQFFLFDCSPLLSNCCKTTTPSVSSILYYLLLGWNCSFKALLVLFIQYKISAVIIFPSWTHCSERRNVVGMRTNQSIQSWIFFLPCKPPSRGSSLFIIYGTCVKF